MSKGKRCRCKCKGKYHGNGRPEYLGTQKRMSLWTNEESKSNLNFGEHFKPDKILLELVH